MDRSPRLRRYQRKEYSQTVAFPVEIVGRDNLVRRYSFDDAVRLYQRRIQTAPMRYADGETVNAEIRHCNLRIDQLRRSYLETSGLAWLPDVAREGVLKSTLAADVTAFLRRLLGDSPGAGTALQLVPVSGGEAEVFWVKGGPIPSGSLLYAYRLEGEAAPQIRLALERDLARLRSTGRDAGAERLFVGVVGPDLALLLAGTQAWSGPSGLLNAAVDEAATEGDPWRDGMAALHDGQVGLALARLEAGLDAEPARLVLSRSTALVALLAAEPERAEFSARLGLLAAPADPLLTYVLGLSLFAQDREAEARASLRASRSAGSALLLALDALARGHLVEAKRQLVLAKRGGEGEWYALRGTRRAREAYLALVLVRLALAGSAALSVVALGGASPVVGLFALGAAIVFYALERRGRTTSRASLRAMRVGDIRLCIPEMLPREAEQVGRQ